MRMATWSPGPRPRARSARAKRADRSSSCAYVTVSRLVPITIAGASGVRPACQLGVIGLAVMPLNTPESELSLDGSRESTSGARGLCFLHLQGVDEQGGQRVGGV